MPLSGKKSSFRSLIAVFTVVFFVVLGFFQVNSALASVPREINYQSRLRSSTLAPITTATDIQFSIYSSQTLGAYTDTASSSGPLLWKGVYDGGACPQITPDADGYFAVQLGSACSPFPSYIDWNQTLFLGVRIGADAEASPRVQLSAFPYALNAEAVDTFSASSTAAANTLLALDQNLNFNILTGGFLGAYFTMSSSTVTSTIAGHFDVQGNTTLGSSSADLITVNGRFNADLVPNVDLAYSLGNATNRWNGEFGTVTTTNLNVLGPANFTDITWVNATGTNTTSTNLFATNVGATYINFNSATGVSINLTNTLYINTIAINATGTTSTNSGAWLIGVFDEFTFSNSTNVQDVLDDLDTQIAAAASTTLQTAHDNGRTITTVPSRGVEIYGANNGSAYLSWHAALSVTGDEVTPGFSSSTGFGIGYIDNGVNSPMMTVGSNIKQLDSAPFGYHLFDPSTGSESYEIGVIDGSTSLNFGLLKFTRSGTTLEAVTGTLSTVAASGLSFSTSNGGVTFSALNQSAQTGAYIFNYGSSSGQGIRIQNTGSAAIASISVGAASPEGALLANSGSMFMRFNGTASGSQMYVKSTNATTTGWLGIATVDMLGTITTSTETLQTVTNRGNATTNTIQFAGGTSTGVFSITGVGTSTVSDNFQILGHMTVGNSGIIDGGSVFASTPGSVVLNVEEEFTSPLADYTRGVASFLRLNSGEASTPASVSAYESSVETAGATNFTSEISGIRGQVSHIGTGILQTAYGSIGISAIGGTGTIGSSIGVFGQSYSFGAGNVTSAYALYGETFNNGAGATITNNYGLYLANQAGVGVNNYNLYSAGSNSLNVMEGSLGIGVTTATSRLQVNSGASTIVPIFTLQNTNGDIQMFNATGSPEGFVSGSVGDLAIDLVGGRFYIKETGTATVTGWAPFATGTGSVAEADTLQTVTARGNTTTNSMEIVRPLIEGDPTRTPYIVLRDTTTTDQGLLLGRYNSGGGSDTNSLIAFTSDLSDPNSATSVVLDYGHQNNYLNMQVFDGGTFQSSFALGQVMQFISALDRGLGPDSSISITNSGSIRGFLGISNPQTAIDFFLATGTPEGVETANSGSLWFNHNATSGDHLYIKTTDGPSTGWVRIATLNDIPTSTTASTDTLQTVTNRGNTTTNAIQFAGGTSTNNFSISNGQLAVNTTTYRDVANFVGSSVLGTYISVQNTNTSADDTGLKIYNENGAIASRFGYYLGGDIGFALSDIGSFQIGSIDVTGNIDLYAGGAARGRFTNTGRLGVGTVTPTTQLHVVATSTILTPIATFANTNGDFQLFNSTRTPEGVITGSKGDLAIDSINGRLYIKETGTSTNTGWVGVATGTATTQHWQKSSNVLSPLDPNVYQIEVASSAAGTLTGFRAVNTNDASNYAGAVIELKGSGAAFTNNVYFGKYSSGFYIPSWAGNGVLATDKNLVLGALGTNSNLVFQASGGYSAPRTIATASSSLFTFTTNVTVASSTSLQATTFTNATGTNLWMTGEAVLGNYATLPSAGLATGSIVYASVTGTPMYWNGSSWVALATSTAASAEADTLQTVTNRGNSTTNTIQFAGGTSTDTFVMTKGIVGPNVSATATALFNVLSTGGAEAGVLIDSDDGLGAGGRAMLTLNGDYSGGGDNIIKFQANGVDTGSIDGGGVGGDMRVTGLAGNSILLNVQGGASMMRLSSAGGAVIGRSVNTASSTLDIQDTIQSATSALLTISNSVGYYQTFIASSSPEGLYVGRPGDIAVDVNNGRLYIKETGHGTNTGWVGVVTSTASTTAAVASLHSAYQGPSGTGSGRNIFAGSGAVTITVPTTGTTAGLVVNNLETSSYINAAEIYSTGTNLALFVQRTNSDFDTNSARFINTNPNGSSITVESSDTYLSFLTNPLLSGGTSIISSQSSTGVAQNLYFNGRSFDFRTTPDGVTQFSSFSMLQSGASTFNVSSTEIATAWKVNNFGTGNSLEVYDGGNALSDTTPFVIDEDGSLMIGGFNPSSKLHVHSNAATGTAILTLENTFSNMQVWVSDINPEGVQIGSMGDLFINATTGIMYIKQSGNVNATGWVAFATGTNAADTFQTVTARGNTTTLPIYVQNTSTFRDILPETGLTYNLGASTSRWNSAWINTLNLGTSTWSMTQNGDRQFQILNGPGGVISAGAASRMVINNANGFVGFGSSTNPQWALTVENSLSEAAIVTKSNNAGGTARIGTSDNAGNTLGFYQYGASVGGALGNIPFATGSFIRSNAPSGLMLNTDVSAPIVIGTNNIEAMRVTEAQNVGIGTAAPVGQFQVAARFDQAAISNIGQSAGTYAVDIQGRYAAVINRDSFELNMVDVTEPANMSVVGSVTVNKSPVDVVILGHYVYVIANDTALLYIYDITDPANISVSDAEAISTGPRALAVQGRYAYTAGDSGRFEVIDVADPSQATPVTSVGICADPARMTVKDRYAYVVCSTGELQIIDIRLPSAPEIVGTIGTNRLPTDVQVQGRYAYVVSNRDKTLEIIDISNPASPVLTGTENTNSDPISVNVQGDMAYVTASGNDTVDFIDITNRTSPVYLGSNRTGGSPQYAAVQGRYIFVPNLNDRTLEVFDLGGAVFQQAEIGGLETDRLATREDASIGGGLEVKGGLHVGRSANINGTFSVYPNRPGSASVFTIDESGQVGIGTLAPDNLLSVNGDASKIGGGTWQTFSDQRLKEDVSAFVDGLNVITKINPVHFRYNGLGGIATGTSYIGVIAQDVQGIAPYMVSSTRMRLNKDDVEKTEVLTFDPNALTYALINSVKEQQGLITDLQNKIGSTTTGSITVADTPIVTPSVFISTSTFEGTIIVKDHVYLGNDTVGQAKMLPGATLLRVAFEEPYNKQPIVNITPVGLSSIDYGVENVTVEGFDIAMRPEQSTAILFNWIAFGAEEGIVTVSDGTTSTVEVIFGGPTIPDTSTDTGIEPPPEIPSAPTSTEPTPEPEPAPEPEPEPTP